MSKIHWLIGMGLVTCLMSSSLSWAGPVEQGLRPVTIQDTIQNTLKNHHSLKSIRENREVVIYERERAKAGWGPRVDATGRLGSSRLSDTTTRSYGADKDMAAISSIGMVLVQPLWDGYATRSRVDTAEATVESMTSRVIDNATTLALDAIIAHIDVLRRREILRLSEANVQRHREILESSKDRESVGADTMADVTQTQGRLARALASLVEARASLVEGEDTYQRVTGMPIPSELAPIELPDPLYTGVEPVFECAKEKNPKIKAYLFDIKAAAGERELAKSAFHPIINLETGPSYSDRGGPGNQWTSSFDVTGTMRWNVFNSGADDEAVKAAAARVRQSRQVLYDLMDTLLLEIQNSWTGYLSAKDQFGHYTEAITYNTETRDSYLEQFMIGQRSLLDVLDAENELFSSSTQAETAHGNVLVGAYRLSALSGTMLEDLKVETKGLLKAPEQEKNPPLPKAEESAW